MTETSLGHLQCRSISAKVFLHANAGNRLDASGDPPMKTQSKLPEVLSVEEITRLFQCTSNLKHRVMLMTTYAAGLRVSEVVNLKLKDIDSERMMIRICQGKGTRTVIRFYQPVY